MQVTKNITLDLLETGSPVIIKAKQNDRNTRYIAAHLYVGRLDYQVPSGTEIAFRYKKPDGTAGFYDALPDNSPAITVSGNTVTVELVEQVLTAAGCVHCEINMYNAASEKLTTFTFEISVEESVLTDAEIISSDYYNVLTAEIAKALQAVTDATEQAENAAQSAQDAADSASMSKDWAAGQPVTYSGAPVSIAYAGAQRIASITAYGETPQGGTTEAPVALTGISSVTVNDDVTELPIPRPLRRVGEVKDTCRTRVKSVYDKRIVLDGTEAWAKRTNVSIVGGSAFYPNNFITDALINAPVSISEYFVGRAGLTTALWEARQVGSYVGVQFNAPFTEVSDFTAWLAAHPLTVYYQSTAYDGTNGLDVMESTYNVGYIENYAGESITTAWISSTGALTTGAEVAYVLATPETYAADPIDFDNAAGPLTVMTGGEVEVRMTELLGKRSDVSNNTVAFTEAAQDTNIQTGETLSTLFGKIKKRFSNIYNKTESDERYATAAQGEKADDALPKTGGTISGNLTVVQDLTVQRAFNGMMIKAGTKIVTTANTTNRAELFTSDQLNTLFGTSGVTYNATNSVVVVANGDYETQSKNITAGFVNSKWAIFSADGSNLLTGGLRVNYVAVKFA